jgi:hypothetical protein
MMEDQATTREDLLARLETMPDELRRAAAALGQARHRERPPGGGFCLLEQAWHLADLEREGYGERLRRILDEAEPHLLDFDGARAAVERDYRSRSLEEGLEAFAVARAANLTLLRSLAEEAWERAATQEGVGRVTLADIPRMMGEHDTSHRAEIAALVSGAPPERLPARA